MSDERDSFKPSETHPREPWSPNLIPAPGAGAKGAGGLRLAVSNGVPVPAPTEVNKSYLPALIVIAVVAVIAGLAIGFM